MKLASNSIRFKYTRKLARKRSPILIVWPLVFMFELVVAIISIIFMAIGLTAGVLILGTGAILLLCLFILLSIGTLGILPTAMILIWTKVNKKCCFREV